MRTYKELIQDAVQLVRQEDLPAREFKKRAALLLAEAERFGVDPEIRGILNSKKPVVKKAAPRYNYNNIPLRNAAEVKKAGVWFTKNRDRFEYATRRKHATSILKAADAFGVDFDEETNIILTKSAGLGLASKEAILHELNKRAEYLKNTGKKDLHGILTKVANEVSRIESSEELHKANFLTKMAEFVDGVDRKYGIVYKYNKGFSAPEDFIFIGSLEPICKTASLVGNVKTGKYYAPEDIEKLDLTKFEELLGRDFSKCANVAGIGVDVLGIKEWLRTATTEQAKLFDILANEQDIYHTAEKVPQE